MGIFGKKDIASEDSHKHGSDCDHGKSCPHAASDEDISNYKAAVERIGKEETSGYILIVEVSNRQETEDGESYEADVSCKVSRINRELAFDTFMDAFQLEDEHVLQLILRRRLSKED